jgi:P-type E1-E2 ATPase
MRPERAPLVVALPEGPIELSRVVLDLNGTLALDGRLLPGVASRVRNLRRRVDLLLVSGDTFGTAHGVARELDIPLRELEPLDQAGQKLRIVRQLGARSLAMIGNGRNDASALAEVALGICVIGPEGAAREALCASDIIVGSPESALDLLLNPARILATLRR